MTSLMKIGIQRAFKVRATGCPSTAKQKRGYAPNGIYKMY